MPTPQRSRPATSEGQGRKPKHREIFDTLLSEIASGRFRPGDRMPTEAELAKTYSASRTTIARAMNDLKARGLLLRQRGGGTRIAHKENVRRIALFMPMATDAMHLDFLAARVHSQMADLASRQADDLRLQFISRTGGDQVERTLAAVDDLIDKGVQGVLYYPIESPADSAAQLNRLVVDKIRSVGLVLLLVERDIVRFPQRSEFPVVTFDNWNAGHLLADHLIEKGRRRVLFVASADPSTAVADRMRGVADAVDEANLRSAGQVVEQIEQAEMTADHFAKLVEEFNPDAIIAQTDHDAATVARNLTAMGKQIGAEIALAGFGDQPIAEALVVPLTTVRFPVESLVAVCYERLMKQLANPDFPDRGVTSVDVELVVRASTAGR